MKSEVHVQILCELTCHIYSYLCVCILTKVAYDFTINIQIILHEKIDPYIYFSVLSIMEPLSNQDIIGSD